jgi:hypothetical protein
MEETRPPRHLKGKGLWEWLNKNAVKLAKATPFFSWLPADDTPAKPYSFNADKFRRYGGSRYDKPVVHGRASFVPQYDALQTYSASKDVGTLRGGSWDNWGGYNRVIGGGLDLDDPTFDPEPQQRSNRLLDAGYQTPLKIEAKGGRR